jgi:hypothetical protein
MTLQYAELAIMRIRWFQNDERQVRGHGSTMGVRSEEHRERPRSHRLKQHGAILNPIE